jgi:hypothetical protein
LRILFWSLWPLSLPDALLRRVIEKPRRWSESGLFLKRAMKYDLKRFPSTPRQNDDEKTKSEFAFMSYALAALPLYAKQRHHQRKHLIALGVDLCLQLGPSFPKSLWHMAKHDRSSYALAHRLFSTPAPQSLDHGLESLEVGPSKPAQSLQ